MGLFHGGVDRTVIDCRQHQLGQMANFPPLLVVEIKIWRLNGGWKSLLALWDELNVELMCQSVLRDMMFLTSNSLHNLRGQKWSCPCYHARHLQQIHWSKLLCGMYGFTAKSSVPRPKVYLTIQNLDMVIKCCNRRFGRETIHPAQKFSSMNLLQMPCMIT